MSAKSSKSSNVLRRYTELPALIHLLRERAITLLDPASWDDKNDSTYLRLYREKAKLSTLLALCFTEDVETYHHWHVFAPGSSGVCIVFDREAIERGISAAGSNVTLRKVRYLRLVENRAQPLKRADLLHSKRYAFRHEQEVRILYRSRNEKIKTYNLAMPISAIKRVYLSPWLHPALRDGVKEQLHTIEGCKSLKIYRSTLTSNREWRKLGEAAT